MSCLSRSGHSISIHGRNSQSLHRLLDPSWTQRGKALLGTKHPLVFAEINERASGRKLLADALGFARFVLHERSHRVPRSSNLLQATNST